MNEEIKEILDNFKNYKNRYNECNETKFIIIIRDIELLLNYITNLQEKNQKLKKQLNCKEYFSSTMPENTEFVILTKNNYDRQQKDLALENIELKQENQKLNKIIDELEKILKDVPNNDASNWQYGRESLAEDILDELTELKKEVE